MKVGLLIITFYFVKLTKFSKYSDIAGDAQKRLIFEIKNV